MNAFILKCTEEEYPTFEITQKLYKACRAMVREVFKILKLFKPLFLFDFRRI
jgi:hypothetical protein